MANMFNLNRDYSSVHQKRSGPEPSCVSMRSDASMDNTIYFKSEDTQHDLRYYISIQILL